MIPRYIRRAINSWFAFRAHRSLRKAVPGLAALDTIRGQKARQHRSGARQIDVERKRLVTARLRMELSR